MIPAQKSGFWDWVMYRYLLRMLRRSFHNVHIRGLDYFDALPAKSPAIGVGNHTNWWDGLIIFLMTRRVRQRDFYLMMEEKQLRNYSFFTRLGAFSVDLDDKLKSAVAVRYALRLLKRPRTLLWLFPQGRIVPPHEPVEARHGAHYLATRVPGCHVIPVAFRYAFFREDQPLALVEVGEPVLARETNDERIAGACNTLAARLDEVIRAQDLTGFEAMLSPRLAINKKWEWVVRSLRGEESRFEQGN